MQSHGANTAYTHAMKSTTGPENTGGNPKVGVPVQIHRPSFFSPLPFSMSYVSCLPSPAPFPTHNPHTPPSSRVSSRDESLALPHEATRARTAFIATHLLEQAEGSISCPQLAQDSHQLRSSRASSLRGTPFFPMKKPERAQQNSLRLTGSRSLRALLTFAFAILLPLSLLLLTTLLCLSRGLFL